MQLSLTAPNLITVAVALDGTASVSWAGRARPGFADQSAAETFAEGIVAGLRAAGYRAQVTIYVPEQVDAAEDADLPDDLGFADLDRAAMGLGAPHVPTPEVDPVAARLARDVEAGHYRAAALGL